MWDKVVAAIKTVAVMVVAGGLLIASFYAAYLFIFVAIMAVVGFIAYAVFNWDRVAKWYESED
jgi:hypothetical protein